MDDKTVGPPTRGANGKCRGDISRSARGYLSRSCAVSNDDDQVDHHCDGDFDND